MKALTIQQPWASLIFQGRKDIENRNWYTYIRGRVLIHAGKTIDRGGYEFMAEHGIVLAGPPLPTGAIIGSVEIADVVTKSDSIWFCGKYGFVLQNPIPCSPIAIRGALGFWDCDINR
jgi:hypothetical protein